MSWERGNSPDRKWSWAVEEGSARTDIFITHLVNAGGSIEWFIQPEVGKTGWQSATYIPEFWSPKEPYVYLTGRGCCSDGPATHYTSRSLVRFNLKTGQLSMLLPWNDGEGAYSIGFSPVGAYLLWSAGGEHSVHIVQLHDGHEKLVLLPERYRDIGENWDDTQKGWSPDEKKVILEIYMDCESGSDNYCYKVAFIVIETGTGRYQQIDNLLTQAIGVNSQWDYQITWIDNETIRLSVGSNQVQIKVNIAGPPS